MRSLLALIFAFLCWPAQALMLTPSAGQHAPLSMHGQMAVLRDPGGRMGLDAVRAADRAGRFVAQPDSLSFGFTDDAVWLRLQLQRQRGSPADWMLEVAPPYLHDVGLYAPAADGGYRLTQLGELYPYADRPVPHRSFIFPLQLTGEEPVTLYLRVKTSSVMQIRVNLWQVNGLLSATQSDTALYSAYFGILALCLLSNLAFWLWQRERMYAAYCAYLAMQALVMAETSGLASQCLFPHWPLVANRLVGISIVLAFWLKLNFFVIVLRLRQHWPTTRKVFLFVQLLYGGFLLAALAGQYRMVAPWVYLCGGTTNIAIAIAGPWLLWRGYREYQFYVLAFLANFAAVPLAAINLMAWVSVGLPIEPLAVLAALVHLVLLNFAVADRARRSEASLLAVQKEAEQFAVERAAVRQQQQFVAMISHEFRTPLAVIDATAQSVDIACSLAAPPPYAFIGPRQEKIRRAVRRMVSLLDNFLTSERLDFYETKAACEVVDLRSVAGETARSWQHLLSHPEQMQLDLGSEAAPALINPALTSLALSNLIDNAIKYSPAGAPIALRVGRSKGYSWVEVEDGGVGIAAEELGQIFEKFYRGPDAQSIAGAGLGLHLVRSIIRNQGGEVEVRSQLGAGSRFRLRMALAS